MSFMFNKGNEYFTESNQINQKCFVKDREIQYYTIAFSFGKECSENSCLCLSEILKRSDAQSHCSFLQGIISGTDYQVIDINVDAGLSADRDATRAKRKHKNHVVSEASDTETDILETN